MSNGFTNEDYKSDMGMVVSVWGPIQWSMLHIISFNYPVKPTDDDKTHYYNYIMNLTNVLPCKACRDNLVKNLKAMKFSLANLKNRETFSRFVYDLHNEVNKMLGKPKYSTYENVRDRHELFRAKCVDGVPTKLLHKPGCVKPLNNIKSRCIINIVPFKEAGLESFVIDHRCHEYKLASKLVLNERKKSSKRSKKGTLSKRKGSKSGSKS